MSNLQELLDELSSVQFIENSGAEAAIARREAADIVKQAHAAGVAAERARVVAVLDAENAELLEWAKEAQVAGDEEGLSAFKADLGGLYLLRRKLLREVSP